MINTAISNFLNDENNDINIQECFDEMFSGLSNPILSGVFLSLMKLKDENFDDLLSGINSARNAIKINNLDYDNDFLLQNICLSENPKYLDIAFALDVVSSCAEIGVVKSIPSCSDLKNNSFNILKGFGVDISNLNKDNFEKNKFLYDFIPSESPYLKYTTEISRALPYKTILDKINPFLNPYNIKNCSLAVSGRENTEKYAKLCLELGYKNSIVFSGGDFPYVLIEGKTSVSEAWKNKIFSYTVTPELLGIKPNSLDEIRVENANHNKEILSAVFENKLKNSYYDVIVINSGLALYIVKKAKSLMEGIDFARKIIDEGTAKEKLNALKKINPS